MKLSPIPHNIDTSRTGFGNLARELIKLRREVKAAREVGLNQSEVEQTARQNSPYLPDRQEVSLIHGGPQEDDWRQSEQALKPVEAQAQLNLKKLIII